ncbi:retinoid-inducible serine carboxypeptidase [Drosophila tropicalis]|uniref:retinoid-inducible serine carboxypeptidase n=1 Tax=Drosophila tropicalis TaxID=46794 RepID=UPI0035ABD991
MRINYQILGVLLLQWLIGSGQARRGFGPGEQDWDYVQVRDGAHLFYWLYYTTANVTRYTERPLVIWLQGGPGVASTGGGCFEQLGPIDIEGRPRESNWVKHVNVLFIDSPVGTGFSYVESHGRYAENNQQIAQDLVTLMKSFLTKHKEFQTVPLHIFSESYGGKMAPEFALELYLSTRQPNGIVCDPKSVVVGNPWTSPLDSTLAYAPFLLQLGIVDQTGYVNISSVAADIAQLVYQGRWLSALEESSKIQAVIADYTDGVFLYNTQKRVRLGVDYHDDYGEDPKLCEFMRHNVTEALQLTNMSEWMVQNASVFLNLGDDIFKPAVNIVTRLLNETPLRVGVYSGILDLLCATPGTVNWINRMKWQRKDQYANSKRKGFRINGVLEGYEKHGGGFSMFWIYRAGHMVQQDNPTAMGYILKEFTNYG